MNHDMLRTAEFVLPGHPDKIADAIADRLVEAAMNLDADALVGVEVALHRSAVFVDGRIAGNGAEQLSVETLVRDTYREIGHDQSTPPAADELAIMTDLCVGPLLPGEREARRLADDQSIVVGYATSLPGVDGLPPEHAVARRLAMALWELCNDPGAERVADPDGKVIVFLAEGAGVLTLTGVSVSLQHGRDHDRVAMRARVTAALEAELRELALAIPGLRIPDDWRLDLNAAGDFVEAGPHGDNGLTGKKLVMDFYGPRVPIGGGAMSGKDFHKADRVGPLIARDLALLVTQRFGCRECTVTLAIRPGDETFQLVRLDADRSVPLSAATGLVDLTLASRSTWPSHPLPELARWGHFAPLPQPAHPV